ncbi:flagellar filament capping protein FliD [Massilia glaciei]|uniref:Flagellar hook-associated protein 2 n=1 Tax=Massilia glaciei TaxID=1524097 RepID=A0A2U2HF39_9BURK|nr:flagellar filament capping protein FliD [Massilia glaciei]PWF42660.1 flagellar hook protein FliD [Massilia glaciei]
MGLSSAGIGSNLDVDGIVSKLMSVEQAPLAKLIRQEASYQTKLSGFGTLKGALSAFQTAIRGLSDISKFQGVKVGTGDASVATATASAGASAVPGTYALKVSQLAQAQKLVAGGVASSGAPVGQGVLSFDFGRIGLEANNASYDADTGRYDNASFTSAGAGVKTVTIDAGNDSLAGIRDAINAAAIGVSATIINDGSGTPFRLALTSTATGQAASMKISVADTGPGTGLSSLLAHDPAADQALTQTLTAQNAEFTVDGVPVSKSGNSVTDVLGGVTLNLLKVGESSATIARDTASVATAVAAFVKAYNDINQNFTDAAAYNPATKQAAILNGEASVRNMQGQMRAVLNAAVGGGAGAFSRLSEIGVTLQKDGQLALDSTKLNKALETNFGDFAGLFAAAGKSGDSLVAYKGFSEATKPGAYALEVTGLATRGAAVGAGAAGLTIEPGNDTLEVTVNGVSATITLEQKPYASAAALAAEVQSKLNGAASLSAAGASVTVSADGGGALSLVSGKYGSASNVSITGGNGQANLNFAAATVTAGLDVAGTINGLAASGNGQVLTSATGDSTGLALTIDGGALGARGTVNYSQGYAFQFDKLASAMLGAGGALGARTEGIAASIKTLGKSKEALGVRLAAIEQRYRAQFTALDLMISRMSTTTSFLTQQLDQLSRMSGG